MNPRFDQTAVKNWVLNNKLNGCYCNATNCQLERQWLYHQGQCHIFICSPSNIGCGLIYECSYIIKLKESMLGLILLLVVGFNFGFAWKCKNKNGTKRS